MARRRNRGRPVDGVFLLDKPRGLSSNQALQRVRWLFVANKAGHTGSLDPLATGVLPICLGEATKFSQYLLDSDKCYRTTVTLGVSTTTGDAEGEVISTTSAGRVTRADVEAVLEQFRGPIEQVPPMYSALKVNGQPLYKLARQGVEIAREARQVEIFELTLEDFRPGDTAELELSVHCSKGTYIRSLAEDIGSALDCGGHVSALRRTAAGPFQEAQTLTLEGLEAVRGDGSGEALDHLLLPMDVCMDDYMAVELDAGVEWYFRRGQPVIAPQAYREGQEGDIVRVFSEAGSFLGAGEILDDGRVTPRRLVVEHDTGSTESAS